MESENFTRLERITGDLIFLARRVSIIYTLIYQVYTSMIARLRRAAMFLSLYLLYHHLKVPTADLQSDETIRTFEPSSNGKHWHLYPIMCTIDLYMSPNCHVA